MLNVVKERKGEVLSVRLMGSIEENVNFEQLIGPPPSEIHLNCKEVIRINSEGVKSWIRYFQSVRKKGIKVKFEECSTVTVEQINLISNFASGAQIESIYAPFACEKCRSEFVCLFKTDELRKTSEVKLPSLKCPKCNAALIFDDVAHEYFAFLKNRAQS